MWWPQMPPWWPPQPLQPQQQQQQEPRPDRVKMGEFFDERPAAWFNLLEGACFRNHVLLPKDRYNVAVSALENCRSWTCSSATTAQMVSGQQLCWLR